MVSPIFFPLHTLNNNLVLFSVITAEKQTPQSKCKSFPIPIIRLKLNARRNGYRMLQSPFNLYETNLGLSVTVFQHIGNYLKKSLANPRNLLREPD